MIDPKIELQPVTDHPHLGRDKYSGAVVNTNRREYENYMRGLEQDKKKNKSLNDLQNEISELKSEMGDIKSLLLTLVQKNHDN